MRTGSVLPLYLEMSLRDRAAAITQFIMKRIGEFQDVALGQVSRCRHNQVFQTLERCGVIRKVRGLKCLSHLGFPNAYCFHQNNFYVQRFQAFAKYSRLTIVAPNGAHGTSGRAQISLWMDRRPNRDEGRRPRQKTRSTSARALDPGDMDPSTLWR